MKIAQSLILILMCATGALGATPSLIILPDHTVFPPLPVGASGPSRTITVQLSQTGSLMLTGVTTSPGFAAQIGCNPDLPPGILCPIPVTFVPQAAGPTQGNVSISYTSSAAATQTTPVCGTGLPGPGDFAIGFVFDCFATSSGIFNLAVYPNAFNGTVSLSCVSVPASGACSVVPATATLSGSTAVNITVNATTTVGRLHPSFTEPARALTMLSLASVVLFLGVGRGVRRRVGLFLILCGFAAIVFAGCGGPSAMGPSVSTVTITASSNGVTHQSTLNLTPQ